MACPNEANKQATREEKIRKYGQLCFEIRERRPGYTVIVVPNVIGFLGGGMKNLKTDIKNILSECHDNEINNVIQ